MAYFVAYTKDGKKFDFNKRCNHVTVLNGNNDMIVFLRNDSNKRTTVGVIASNLLILGIIPKEHILYILSKED